MNFFFSDCETETIYTSQSRDTVSTEDEDDDDDDEMVAEYEPTSGAETERPPQVTNHPAHSTTIHTKRMNTQIQQLLCFKSYNIFSKKYVVKIDKTLFHYFTFSPF